MEVTNNESLAAHIRSLCRRLDSEMSYDETSDKYIIVDLGNIHNFLPYADNNLNLFDGFQIVGFADHHFNGYGIHPRCTRNVSLHVSGSSRNAADCSMIWFISRCAGKRKCEFYILTKDKGFREISNLCCQSGSQAFFFSDTDAFIQYYRHSFLQGLQPEMDQSALTNYVI